MAVLPDRDQANNSGTKVYRTVVKIDDDVAESELKPGMTATVDINAAMLDDVLAVPVTAIVSRGRTSWCLVDVDGRPEPRRVQLGLTDRKSVEVKSGLAEGDRVVLNPDDVDESITIPEEEEAEEKNEDGKANETGDEGDKEVEGEPRRPGRPAPGIAADERSRGSGDDARGSRERPRRERSGDGSRRRGPRGGASSSGGRPTRAQSAP